MRTLHKVFSIISAAAICGCGGGMPKASPADASSQLLPSPQSSQRYPTNKTLLFEAVSNNAEVAIFDADALLHNPPPIATLHSTAGWPTGLAMDSYGTLYVANSVFTSDVEEYPKGSLTPTLTITDSIKGPQALAIDGKDNLYVLNGPPEISVYPRGATTPSVTFTGGGMREPGGLAFDRSWNLYISDVAAGAVFEVPAGHFTVRKLHLKDLVQPNGVAIEPLTGYLWVTDSGHNSINVYDLAKSESPIKTLPGNGNPSSITASALGRTEGEIAEDDLSTDDVYIYRPNRYKQHTAIVNTGHYGLPDALLIRKP